MPTKTSQALSTRPAKATVPLPQAHQALPLHQLPPPAQADAALPASTSANSQSTTNGATPKPKKAAEPSSETLSNFARVTPKQLAYVVFEADARFKPVRPVSSLASSSTPGSGAAVPTKKSVKYAGGGGILVLVDTKPGTGEPEWVLSLADKAAAAAAAADAAAAQPEANGDAIGNGHATSGSSAPMEEDTTVVEPPAPFEVIPSPYYSLSLCIMWCSILVSAQLMVFLIRTVSVRQRQLRLSMSRFRKRPLLL